MTKKSLATQRWEAAVLRERELETQKKELDDALKPLFELQGRMLTIINRHAQVLEQLRENEKELLAAYEAMREEVQ